MDDAIEQARMRALEVEQNIDHLASDLGLPLLGLSSRYGLTEQDVERVRRGIREAAAAGMSRQIHDAQDEVDTLSDMFPPRTPSERSLPAGSVSH